MSLDEIELEAEERMEKAVDFLRHEVRTIRTGRASSALVEHIRVDVTSYSSSMELRQLATIGTPESNLIVVKPYDPTTITDIEKALEKSNIGITPITDGKIIRLPVPPLSGERRQQLAQQVKQLAEHQRVAVRNIRRDANKQIDADEKGSAISEDDAKQGKEDIQELTDKYIKIIDKILDAKIKEIEEI